MTELLYSCSSALDQSTVSCKTDYGDRISTILFSKSLVSMAGNQPTAAEFGTAYNNGEIVFLTGITNGHRTFVGENQIEIARTEYYDKRYQVTGRLKLVNEAVARACELLDRRDSLYMWYFTDKQYCFGGYETNPDFSLIKYDGKGNPIYIDFKLEFFTGIDYALYDEAYGTFTYSYLILATEDSYGLTTEDGSIIIL